MNYESKVIECAIYVMRHFVPCVKFCKNIVNTKFSHNFKMTLKNTFGEKFDTFKYHWDDFLGDCKSPAKHINQRVWHSRLWSLVKFLDVYLRSIGEVRKTCNDV